MWNSSLRDLSSMCFPSSSILFLSPSSFFFFFFFLFPYLHVVPLFFSHSHFSNFQAPKTQEQNPKQKLIGSETQTQKKKKNPHEEEKEERNSGVYEPPCRWFWSTSELQSLHWLGALRLCLSVCVFILLLKLKLKWICCLLWVEMGLLFVVGLWVCWVSRFAWVCWFHCFSLGLSLGLLMNVLL